MKRELLKSTGNKIWDVLEAHEHMYNYQDVFTHWSNMTMLLVVSCTQFLRGGGTLHQCICPPLSSMTMLLVDWT